MKRIGKEGWSIKWEARAKIGGERIFLGLYDYRSDALKAEEVARKIRKALERAAFLKRKKEKELKGRGQ